MLADGGHERFRVTPPGAAVFHQPHGKHTPIRPVEHEQTFPILLGELGVAITDNTGRRSAPERRNDRGHVQKGIRTLPTSRQPAGVSPGRYLKDSSRAIPRQRHIPLAIAIECEQVTRGAEVEVVGVAKSVSQHFRTSEIRLQPQDASRFGGRHGGIRSRNVAATDARHVSGNDVPPPVRALPEGVDVVLTASARLEEHLGRAIRPVVSILVSVANQAAVGGA